MYSEDERKVIDILIRVLSQKEDIEPLGKLITRFRLRNRLKISQLSMLVGLPTDNVITDLENGTGRLTDIDLLNNIICALDVTKEEKEMLYESYLKQRR